MIPFWKYVMSIAVAVAAGFLAYSAMVVSPDADPAGDIVERNAAAIKPTLRATRGQRLRMCRRRALSVGGLPGALRPPCKPDIALPGTPSGLEGLPVGDRPRA